MTAASPLPRWPWIALILGWVVLTVAGCFGKKEVNTPPSAQPPVETADIADQIHIFCGTACHKYPSPDSFPRRYWRKEVERGYRFFEQSGMAIKVPPIESVVHYYEDRAPEELAVPTIKSASKPLDLRFEKLSYPGPAVTEKFAISNVNLVHLPEPGKAPAKGLDILACDMRNGLVMLMRPYEASPVWKVLAKVSNPAHTEVLDLDGDGILDILVANLGNFPPTDRLCGSVVWLRGRPDGTFTPITLLKDVGRVADVQAADFRGNGKKDLIAGVFGWQVSGELLYLENQTTDWNNPKFVPRVVDPRHGCIHVIVTDLNGDGKLDFVALFAQEHETIVAFLNQGDGTFKKQTLFTGPDPAYGSSGIQLVDLNNDGKPDILYTNGDTLDDPYLYKPYHSIQWLENKGDMKFEHHPIAPMFGVHRAVAADFFGTGRKAIVAASYLPNELFPERGKRNADALILLEQTAPGQFERHLLQKTDCDHVTCAVGDLYGNGQIDIVVGNFSAVATPDPVTIWKALGP